MLRPWIFTDARIGRIGVIWWWLQSGIRELCWKTSRSEGTNVSCPEGLRIEDKNNPDKNTSEQTPETSQSIATRYWCELSPTKKDVGDMYGKIIDWHWVVIACNAGTISMLCFFCIQMHVPLLFARTDARTDVGTQGLVDIARGLWPFGDWEHPFPFCMRAWSGLST